MGRRFLYSREKDLLIDRRADATLPDGSKLGLDGFQIVDAEKFAVLDEATIVAWHRQGLLALVHAHLASLERFADLLKRQTAVSASSPAGEPRHGNDMQIDETPATTEA